MENGGILFIVNTLVAQKIQNYFSLDTMSFGLILSAINGFTSKFDIKEYSNIAQEINVQMIYSYIWQIALIICVLYIVYKYKHLIFDMFKTRYISAEISLVGEQDYFEKYAKYHKDFFDIPEEIMYGDPEKDINQNEHDTEIDSERVKPVDDIYIYFNDTKFNVKGYYFWSTIRLKYRKEISLNNGEKQKSEIDANIPILNICIEKKNLRTDIREYIDDIKKTVDDIEKDKVQLYHKKIFIVNNELTDNEYKYYDGNNENKDMLEKKYMDTFFHENKEELWNPLKIINDNPNKIEDLGQVASAGMILYGPPGSGKSSWIYRVARVLQRHIICLDISSINNKFELYRQMRVPYINGYYVSPDKVIYVFDEFDLTIEKLNVIEEQNKKALTRWKNGFDKPLENSMINKFNQEKTFNDKKKIFATTEKYNESDSSDDDSSDYNYNESSDGEIKKKKSTRQQEYDEIKKKKSTIQQEYVPLVEKEKTYVSEPVWSYKNYGYDTDSITVKDLLEIFQGVVPLHGAIIIATTNELDKIKEICPALVREGRLTPVKFDYATNKIVNEMCLHFYEKEFKIDIDIYSYNICISYLTGLITKSKTIIKDDPYEYFIKKIKEKCQ